MIDAADPATADALASLYDAGALRVPPWMALTTALASVRPDGLGATIAWLVAHQAELERAYADGGAAPLAVAAGSQLAAAMLLAAPAVAAWPATPPGARAWAAAALLALLCTGLAYILYFRLISRVGPARAISVTFLIPAFAALWGFVVLGEVPTVEMLAGCAVILLGTALAAGALRLPQRA